MTTAKELGISGLEGFIGKKVELSYPRYENIRGHKKRVVIKEVFDYSTDPIMMALAEFEGEEGLTWIWKSTDVKEIHPGKMYTLFQRLRGK